MGDISNNIGSSTNCGNVPRATFWRLPNYLRYLEYRRDEGLEMITSTMIADELGLNSIQVRKDLAMISSRQGRPKTGFEVNDLISDLNAFLGYNQKTRAVLVGCGGLGSALLSYSGFVKYGLHIVAAFDHDENKVGHKLIHDTECAIDYSSNEKKNWSDNALEEKKNEQNADLQEHSKHLVLSFERDFDEFVKSQNATIGIITVPSTAAQVVADKMVRAGIVAIWNFAPAYIKVPKTVTIHSEDMAGSLAALAISMKYKG